LASYSDEAYRLLAQWLDVDTGLIIEVLEALLADRAYESFRIPKPGGEEWREILDPYGGLKEIQRRILDRLLYTIPVSNAAHGAVPSRSVVSNARQHLPDARHLLAIDLRHAFPSVRFRRVHGIFRRYVRPIFRSYGPLPTADFGGLDPIDEAIHLLAALTTHRQTVRQRGKLQQVFCLPQGAPTSGYLLNLACLELDAKIYKIIEANPSLNLRYSRYLDDLVISSPIDIPDNVQEEIKLAVIKNDFHVHHGKIRYLRSPQPMIACGVMIESGRLVADPELITRCNELLRNAGELRNISDERKLRRRVRGIMAFFRQVYGNELPDEIAVPYTRYRDLRNLPDEQEVTPVAQPPKDARSPANVPELLARWLDIPVETIISVRAMIAGGRAYETWTIDKQNGGQRVITSPVDQLKDLQHRILSRMIYHIPVSNAAHGFIPGRSIVTNALAHLGARHLINLDLKDAFPSVNRHQVELGLQIGLGRVIKKFGLRFPVELRDGLISLLGELLTYNDQLPQGAPTSGYLLNIAAISLDKHLFQLLKTAAPDVVYTRYADDLCFTSKENFPEELLPQIKRTIRKSGFRWNPRKTDQLSSDINQMMEICGIYVDGDRLRLPREKIQTYRSIIRRVGTTVAQGQLDENTRRQIQGIVGFVEMVYGELPRKIAEPYRAYLQQHPDARPKRLYRDKISFYPNVMPNL
jgi:hypothetical protein